MAKYRKLIAAFVGLAVMLLYKWFEIDLLGTESLLVDLIISGLTAFGVYWFPNEPMGEQ